MKGSKLWSIAVLALTACGLLLSASTIAVIDPFFHYHKPLDTLAYNINNQAYQNPGMARNFEYDAVLTGSSMTENFKPSWFDELFGLKLLKVPYSGARGKNTYLILDLALRNNPNVKQVFWGMDINVMSAQATKPNMPLPMYLYDESPWNDVNYLLNKDVLFDRVYGMIQNTKAGWKTTSPDDAYSWSSIYTFRESIVLASYTRSPKAEVNAPTTQFLPTVKANLVQNVLPLVQAYPNTEFTLFFPPYSILFWDERVQNGTLEAMLADSEYVIAELLKYDNVSLFYFQNNADIITNLYRYRDYTHYNQPVNRYMAECFQTGKHLLTKENYKGEIAKLRELILTFDYELFWGDSAPMKRENNLRNYLDLIANSRYTVFLSAKGDMAAGITPQVQAAFAGLGLTANFSGKQNWAYIAVLEEGQPAYETLADEQLVYYSELNGLPTEIKSQGHGIGNYSSIVIDGVQYAMNGQGLNIVVYDKELGRVVDSVCFDTSQPAMPASR